MNSGPKQPQNHPFIETSENQNTKNLHFLGVQNETTRQETNIYPNHWERKIVDSKRAALWIGCVSFEEGIFLEGVSGEFLLR